MGSQLPLITPAQLRVGVYVHLGVGWMHHPFPLNKFKIKSAEQIQIIRGLDLAHVYWDPELSDVPALPAEQPTLVAEPPPSPVVEQQIAAKEARLESNKRRRAAYTGMSKAFHETALTVRAINKNLFSTPARTIADAEQLVGKLVDSFLSASEVLLQVLADKQSGDDQYFHGLNVSILCLMVGRELGLSADICRILGMGGLFHDIGLAEVPSRIIMKKEPLNRAEQELRRLHCDYGLKIARQVNLPGEIHPIIASHHEHMDGTGYPKGLAGEQIAPLVRIVATVNHYDNLCNPPNLADALTPHEALKLMYAQHRGKFDPRTLQTLIRSLGVYPPGTLVKLSNDMLGVVVAVSPSHPLKPSIMLHDENVAPEDAPIVDLSEDGDLSIVKAVRPATLTRAVLDYLCPRQRVSYYFDTRQSGEQGTRKAA